MDTILKKWGNSTGVRLPAPILKQAQLKPNQAVTIEAVATGHIIIRRKAKPAKYTLADLLAGVTKENLHDNTDWKPVGKESL